MNSADPEARLVTTKRMSRPSVVASIRAQDHRHRAPRRGVVDVDGQEAALVVMGVEQGKLLVPMHHVERVVDVQRHRRRRRGIAGTPDIDHHCHQAENFPQGGRILPTRHRRLRAQIPSAVGQAAAGQFERRITAESVEIIGVFPAAGDGQDAGAQDVGQRVDHPRRIAGIGDHRRQLVGQAQPPVRLGQQQHPTI